MEYFTKDHRQNFNECLMQFSNSDLCYSEILPHPV